MSKRRQKFKKYIELNEYENTIYQHLWDTAKAILRGTFISLNLYFRKASNLNSYLNNLEKQKQNKPKASHQPCLVPFNMDICQK